jgi:superfamily II DNA or RNA helicase
LISSGKVTVVAVTWHGPEVVTVVYRETDGSVGSRLLYRADEASLTVGPVSSGWSFDADPALFRLASEARRIRLAYLFDPLLAVHLSQLMPLPHQIQAVYGELLPRQPLRFALCDDPGAGKTIMAGLYIKELALRGDLARCLVVAPGGVVAQWQDELANKFGLNFKILTTADIEASRTGDPFAETDLLIARLDHLARRPDLAERLGRSDWDLVVVDEAHRMAAHRFGDEVTETKRYRLGKLLGSISRNFLLMTATPHAGKEDDFRLFLALLDPDRFEGRVRTPGPGGATGAVDTSDLMRRMVKERLLTFEGRPLFPERVAQTVPYRLSPAELDLYEQVTAYVRDEMNRAADLAAVGEGRRGNRVGFALTVLQRRLASSPEAIYQSLGRRRQRLETDLAAVLAGQRADPGAEAGSELSRELEADDDPDRYDDLADAELEDIEEELVGGASAAATVAELEAEIATVGRLETLARRVRASRTDRKWTELAGLLDQTAALDHPEGGRRKLIVFTEHRDTLGALVERIGAHIGRPEAVVAIHGGTHRLARAELTERFTTDPDCEVLVATDAAGEGINLQRAHLLVNYDLPWNPNRIEQRFGRIHRIGQTEVCHMWNLVATDTREGQVFTTLLDKLERQRLALGGQVFDVLGECFAGRPLRELLIEAVRYGDQPERRAALHRVIDETVGDGLTELVNRHALAADVLGAADLERLRARMDEANARRLQPHYIRAFFLAAIDDAGGRMVSKEPGRYQIHHVPYDLRQRAADRGAVVAARYERVCFEPDLVHLEGRPSAQLLAPGHPLLDATAELIAERHRDLLRQGATLVAPDATGQVPWVLVYLEHSIVDGRRDRNGARQVVSRRFEFVELEQTGATRTSGAAPYLDYRPPTPDERQAVGSVVGAGWLTGDLEGQATDVAITTSVPAHLAEVTERVHARVARVRAAVFERLTTEINHWDGRAGELDAQVAAGRQPRMNPDRARSRAETLAERRARRMADLDAENQLQALPPVVVGAALVVPGGLLARLLDDQAGAGDRPRDTARVDAAAVAAVLAAERELGRMPEEMAHNNPGFDIRSLDTDGHLRFIEVKGRVQGADSVTITRNEILTGLNSDRWTLALVEVGDDDTTVIRYVPQPFRGHVDDLGFAETSRTFAWKPLWQSGGPPS